eukprot:COSAG05_NODE_10707_length_550_cov_1.031042_1_plen_84_part_00
MGDVEESRGLDGISEPIGGVEIDPSDGARIELWLAEMSLAHDAPQSKGGSRSSAKLRCTDPSLRVGRSSPSPASTEENVVHES